MNEICLSCKKHTKCGRAIHETIGCGYYAPLTNEEWFCSLSTEEKAKWIAEEKMNRGYFIFPSMEEAIQDALEWLNEKHEE